MNTIYRLVWNSARRLWVVASELTRAKKKSATTGAALILCGFSAVAGTLSGTQYITGDGNSKNWQELFPVTGLEGDKVSTPSAWEINNEIWGKKATAYLFTAKDIHIKGGQGKLGGTAIEGNDFYLKNNGGIYGGDGLTGGVAIHGNLSVIQNLADGKITGGSGGVNPDNIYGSPDGSWKGGDALVITNLSNLDNQGIVQGGDGGASGYGGAGVVSSQDSTIDNYKTIAGGKGGDAIPGDETSPIEGGSGGDAIKGSNLHIANSGQRIAGKGGNDQADGAALRFTGGVNTLTLYKGNDITGNIVLEQNTAGNSLSITSDVDATVKGDSSVASGANILIQQGKGVNFAGSVFLEENATFTNKNTLLNVSGIDNRGGTLTASNVNVSSWLLNDIRSGLRVSGDINTSNIENKGKINAANINVNNGRFYNREYGSIMGHVNINGSTRGFNEGFIKGSVLVNSYKGEFTNSGTIQANNGIYAIGGIGYMYNQGELYNYSDAVDGGVNYLMYLNRPMDKWASVVNSGTISATGGYGAILAQDTQYHCCITPHPEIFRVKMLKRPWLN
ncbi:TPA: hypothetical protein JLL68_004832 [Escherichia coli]|nr:hypothetical protein [Escherichia coli]